ncbi:LicD family protein [Nocardioides panacisoli]|uniref:class I SAM-dependent methyltransferase n=1 Tax=Nocardioides panacisoli TaxID=627624 RepID=UPI001C62C65E|nr:class I SAM-dependent methyltransferase [Nocardioides panacisoli]QYJ02482.1 LicD family protein [Nocardioides panacisoli]
MSAADGPDPVVRVREDGIEVAAEDHRIFDLVLDGRRIWSFRAERGTPLPDADARVLVAWPHQLRGHLHGTAEVTVADQWGVELAGSEVCFGGSTDRVQVVDAEGRPLVLDAKGRLALPFDEGADALAPLLEAAHRIIGVLDTAGVAAFLAYGTLLGAVREGEFIGHDNDIDLGYVSAARHPVDVMRESFRLERALEHDGLTVERYSGAGFKVLVRDGAGIARWIDVFGGFWHGDRLALMGELLTPFRSEWITPLGSVRLAGETFPAPAVPERLLEAMYGPEWRVPDPTFAFDPDTGARRQLNRWFRGIRQHRNHWDRFYSGRRHHAPPTAPRGLALDLHEDAPGSTVIDVGCGRGQDVAWLAEQGHRAVGVDYSAWAMAYLRGRTDHPEFHTVNLLELRHVLAWGARFARLPGPRSILARHYLDAAPPLAQAGFWRFVPMVLRGGGRLYLEFFAAEDPEPRAPGELVRELDPAAVAEAATAAGGRLVRTSWHDPSGPEVDWGVGRWREPARSCRMVWEWR